jgi:hypothetical protein
MNIFARLRNLLRRFARRVLEKHAEQLYEGPEPPIAQIKVRASAYTLANPEPNRDQWIAFATKLAANCYREGFQRGFEWRAKGWPATGGESPEQRQEQAAKTASLAIEKDPQMADVLQRGFNVHDPMAGLSYEERCAIMRLGPTAEVLLDPDTTQPLGHGNPGFRREGDKYVDEL